MAELFNGIAGSPITYLTADISAVQTTISVADDSALPDAPNICTIGYGEQLETIKYGVKSNGVLQEVERGIEGTPQSWQAGTEVARFFTAYDHNSIIEDFVAHKADLVPQRSEIAITNGLFQKGDNISNYVIYCPKTKLCELNMFFYRTSGIAGGSWYDIGFSQYKPSRTIYFLGERESSTNGGVLETIKCRINTEGWLEILVGESISYTTQYRLRTVFYAI